MMITRIVNYAVNVRVGFATFQTIIKGLVKAFFCLTRYLKTRPLNPENSARLISRIAKTIHCSMWWLLSLLHLTWDEWQLTLHSTDKAILTQLTIFYIIMEWYSPFYRAYFNYSDFIIIVLNIQRCMIIFLINGPNFRLPIMAPKGYVVDRSTTRQAKNLIKLQ